MIVIHINVLIAIASIKYMEEIEKYDIICMTESDNSREKKLGGISASFWSFDFQLFLYRKPCSVGINGAGQGVFFQQIINLHVGYVTK